MPADLIRLLELYCGGVKINDLATEFQISRTTVMTHVERAGAARRRNILDGRVEEARELSDQCSSVAKIGRHLGVNASTVWHAFRKSGIPMRDPQRR